LLFSDQESIDVTKDTFDEYEELLAKQETVTCRTMSCVLGIGLVLRVERDFSGDPRRLVGNLDKSTISPSDENPSFKYSTISEIICLARKYFEPLDTKPFAAYLDEGAKEIYQSREAIVSRLENTQTHLIEQINQFAMANEKAYQERQQKLDSEHRQRRDELEAEYQARKELLESEHRTKLDSVEEREKKVQESLAEIDSRSNQQARRSIYTNFRKIFDARSKTFELTDGAKNKRSIPFWATIFLFAILFIVFVVCISINLNAKPNETNWVAIGTQIGSAIAFIGEGTFFIRWNNQWFQKHADEEFKLKRLDLDIDRANWLIELSFEWKNVTGTDIPTELVEKLSRNLFLADDSQSADMHPTETLLASIFGTSGSVDIEVPRKVTFHREEKGRKKKSEEKE